MKDRSNWLTAAAVSVFVIATGTFMLGKMAMNIKSADIRFITDKSGSLSQSNILCEVKVRLKRVWESNYVHNDFRGKTNKSRKNLRRLLL